MCLSLSSKWYRMIVLIESDKIRFHVLCYLNIYGSNNNLCDLENTKELASIFKLLLSFQPRTLFCNNILHTGLLYYRCCMYFNCCAKHLSHVITQTYS